MTRIVFLHIPKTAGQTVHSELSRIVGVDKTSPIRVHTQATSPAQYPEGYSVYSGHLDWDQLQTGIPDQFIFTILRDPFERIASFYFYLKHKALTLTEDQITQPQNSGMRTARNWSADDYFFGGDTAWQRFILDHYDNFYCSYLATRKVRGSAALCQLSQADVLACAHRAALRLDGIYDIANLSPLEDDIHRLTGQRPNIVGTRINSGPASSEPNRWHALLQCLERDANRQRLHDFARTDAALIRRLAADGLLR